MSMSMREKQVPQGQTTFRPYVGGAVGENAGFEGGWSLFQFPTVTIKTVESQVAIMLHSLRFEIF